MDVVVVTVVVLVLVIVIDRHVPVLVEVRRVQDRRHTDRVQA
jgi:hypothetical protein